MLKTKEWHDDRYRSKTKVEKESQRENETRWSVPFEKSRAGLRGDMAIRLKA